MGPGKEDGQAVRIAGKSQTKIRGFGRERIQRGKGLDVAPDVAAP